MKSEGFILALTWSSFDYRIGEVESQVGIRAERSGLVNQDEDFLVFVPGEIILGGAFRFGWRRGAENADTCPRADSRRKTESPAGPRKLIWPAKTSVS